MAAEAVADAAACPNLEREVSLLGRVNGWNCYLLFVPNSCMLHLWIGSAIPLNPSRNAGI